jgi:hypothetical protein
LYKIVGKCHFSKVCVQLQLTSNLNLAFFYFIGALSNLQIGNYNRICAFRISGPASFPNCPFVTTIALLPLYHIFTITQNNGWIHAFSRALQKKKVKKSVPNWGPIILYLEFGGQTFARFQGISADGQRNGFYCKNNNGQGECRIHLH